MARKKLPLGVLRGPQGRWFPTDLVDRQVAVEMSQRATAMAVAIGESIAGFHLSDGSHRLSLYTWASLEVAWWQDGD